MDRVHTFSKLNRVAARTAYRLAVRPQFFRLQGDLQINMSAKRFGFDSSEVTTTHECFDLSVFDDYEEAAAMLTQILRRLHTPPGFRSRIIAPLLGYGRKVADNLRHVDHGRAHIVVYVEIDFGWPLSAVYEYVLERSAAAVAMVPAAEEAVERMVKRVRVEGGEDDNGVRKRSRSGREEEGISCSICLEDMSAPPAGPAASLPCSHVFHEGCILRWLKESHYCPRCRFQVPTGTK